MQRINTAQPCVVAFTAPQESQVTAMKQLLVR